MKSFDTSTFCGRLRRGCLYGIDPPTVFGSDIVGGGLLRLARTGVRNLIRAGVPERIAMEISGHKSRSMLDRYNIVTPRNIREAGHRMELYLEQQQKAATTVVKGPVQ